MCGRGRFASSLAKDGRLRGTVNVEGDKTQTDIEMTKPVLLNTTTTR
jgi:hypothetical protein